MKLLSLMLVLLVASTADAQLFRRRFVECDCANCSQQPAVAAAPAVATARIPGPRHSTGTGCDCGMCIGIHLRSVHGVDLSGVSDWYTYHDNLHNTGLLIFAPTPQTLVQKMVSCSTRNPTSCSLTLVVGTVAY